MQLDVVPQAVLGEHALDCTLNDALRQTLRHKKQGRVKGRVRKTAMLMQGTLSRVSNDTQDNPAWMLPCQIAHAQGQ